MLLVLFVADVQDSSGGCKFECDLRDLSLGLSLGYMTRFGRYPTFSTRLCLKKVGYRHALDKIRKCAVSCDEAWLFLFLSRSWDLGSGLSWLSLLFLSTRWRNTRPCFFPSQWVTGSFEHWCADPVLDSMRSILRIRWFGQSVRSISRRREGDVHSSGPSKARVAVEISSSGWHG